MSFDPAHSPESPTHQKLPEFDITDLTVSTEFMPHILETVFGAFPRLSQNVSGAVRVTWPTGACACGTKGKGA